MPLFNHKARPTAEPWPLVALVGIIKSQSYQRAAFIIEELKSRFEGTLSSKFAPLTAFEYVEARDAQKKTHQDLVEAFYPEAFIVLSNAKADTAGQLLTIEQFVEWSKKQFGVDVEELYDKETGRSLDFPPEESAESAETTDDTGSANRGLLMQQKIRSSRYAELGTLAFNKRLMESGHKIVYFDISADKSLLGRITVELFNDIVPTTVAHFLKFVEGRAEHPKASRPLSYSSTKISRIIKEGWLQAGEFSTDNGPLLGEPFPDENFVIAHAHRGMVSLVNQGPNSNFSQFMFTFKGMPYFDRKYVCIGRCVDGYEVLDAIEGLDTRHERPVVDVEISDCGLLLSS